MIESTYKSYDELPLFLNANSLKDVLGISLTSAYALIHEKDFPSVKIGNRIVVSKEKFIGVRVPEVRKLAKQYIKDEESKIFLEKLPHEYYDENMLHGLLVAEIKDFESCIKEVE